MSHLVLHIGTHKTATTTIQDTFWHNHTKLADNGVVYPRLPYPHKGHHGLIAEDVGLPKTYHLPCGGRAALSQINRDFGDSDKTVFLSSEEFSRAELGRQANFAEIQHQLSGFGRVTVLCFVRPQWRFLQSIYLEVSRYQSPPRPPILVKQAIDIQTCFGLYLNYSELLDRLERVFPPEDIKLVDFEDARRQRGKVIDIALSAAGSTLSHTDLKPINDGHSNPSSLPIPQWAANLLAEPNDANNTLLGVTEHSVGQSGDSCLLTREEVGLLKQEFETVNQSLATRRALFQPGFKISDPEMPSDCMFREDVSIQDWLEIARELARPINQTTGRKRKL